MHNRTDSGKKFMAGWKAFLNAQKAHAVVCPPPTATCHTTLLISLPGGRSLGVPFIPPLQVPLDTRSSIISGMSVEKHWKISVSDIPGTIKKKIEIWRNIFAQKHISS